MPGVAQLPMPCLLPYYPAAVELSGLAITMADFEEAIGKVQPSVRREGFATTPDVTWDDVGSLTEVRLVAFWLACAVSAQRGCVSGCVQGGLGH